MLYLEQSHSVPGVIILILPRGKKINREVT